MQVGILEDVLEIVPREDFPKKPSGADGEAGKRLKEHYERETKQHLKDRSFRFKLNKETYERIFKYLIDKRAVLRF